MFDHRADRAGILVWLKDAFAPQAVKNAGLLGFAARNLNFLPVGKKPIWACWWWSRHVILSYENPRSNVTSIACIAARFAIRRFLIRRSEMKEELVEIE